MSATITRFSMVASTEYALRQSITVLRSKTSTVSVIYCLVSGDVPRVPRGLIVAGMGATSLVVLLFFIINDFRAKTTRERMATSDPKYAYSILTVVQA